MEHYVGHYPLSEVCLIYPTFWEFDVRGIFDIYDVLGLRYTPVFK
jgi:hypothetical protein